MEVLDEVLQQVHPFLDLDLVDFEEILGTHSSVLGQTGRAPGRWLFKVKPIIFNLRETPKPGKGLLPEATLGLDQTDLAHLQLEEPPLLLHLLGDFCATDFRADHPVLPRVLLLLLLYLGADGTSHNTG